MKEGHDISLPREIYGGILQTVLQSPPKRFAMGQALPGYVTALLLFLIFVSVTR
jgi:hypothetical protein